MAVLSLGVAGLSIGYWWLAMTRWMERFRRRCERRYGVVIAMERGHWSVTSGGPWYRRLGIEMLQLAYFLGVFAGWAIGMGLGIGLLSLLFG